MATETTSDGKIRFGVFHLDVRSGELCKRGVRVPLQGRPVQLLAVLLKTPGQIVTREELRNQLWEADTFVDFDHGLHNAIARLREALGDSADTPRFIETLPRRGYRFIAPVEKNVEGVISPSQPQATSTVSPSGWSSRSARLVSATAFLIVAAGGILGWYMWRQRSVPRPATIHSLAVLPLENLSGNPDEEYFADGMTDELTTDLAKIGSLRVISRTSSMRYKGTHKPLAEIAREMGVDAVVEGSVTRSSNRVRITAQLIDARTDRHLWAESYDRDLSDAVVLQNQIAAAIAGEIRVKLTPAENAQLGRGREVNAIAYDDYLKGRFHFNKRTDADLRVAIDYFNRAVAADPTFALAYVGLADSYNIAGSWVFTAVPRDEARAKAIAFASKALEIDDTLGEAHTSLADAKLLFDCDWKGSEAEFQRALSLSPNYANAHHWYAELLIDSGRFDESISESYKARQLDPLSPMMNSSLASRLCLARRCDEATREALVALELDPNFAMGHSTLGKIYEHQGRFEESIAENRKAVELSGRNPNFLAALARAYALSGDRVQATQILSQLRQASAQQYVAPYQFAVIYSALGQKRQALQALDQAYKEHSPALNNLYVDSWEGGRLSNLRNEPGFIRLLQAVGPNSE